MAGPRSFGVNGIPAPPGIGDNKDPLLPILRTYLEGPTLKLYYDWANDIRKYGPDQYEKGDNLRRKGWDEGLRAAILRSIQERKEGGE